VTPEKKAEYHQLAAEVMEPVLTVAARRLGLAVEEIHATQIEPLRKASRAMLAALKKARPFVLWGGGLELVSEIDAAIAQAEAAGIEETE